MTYALSRLAKYACAAILPISLLACGGDQLISGVDPYAPMVFKEGATPMPLNPANPSTLQPFYVSQETKFKFAVDTDSILIGGDGITRYIVVITNPSGQNQAQYEGIRCDSFQWRLYGLYESAGWRENLLGEWKDIKRDVPDRYQAALAQGAFCNFDSQEKNIGKIIRTLNPNSFNGETQPKSPFGPSDPYDNR